MKKKISLLLAVLIIGIASTTTLSADAKRGQKFYLKKLKICKKDGIKNGAVFAAKHDRHGWSAIKERGELQKEWISICPHGEKKITKMREKDVKNLYDFVWKYASDGEVPSCG
jgi:hypothetical protein